MLAGRSLPVASGSQFHVVGRASYDNAIGYVALYVAWHGMCGHGIVHVCGVGGIASANASQTHCKRKR